MQTATLRKKRWTLSSLIEPVGDIAESCESYKTSSWSFGKQNQFVFRYDQNPISCTTHCKHRAVHQIAMVIFLISQRLVKHAVQKIVDMQFSSEEQSPRA